MKKSMLIILIVVIIFGILIYCSLKPSDSDNTHTNYTENSPQCYCSYCTGKCKQFLYAKIEECPPKTDSELEQSECKNSYCIYESGKCVPKPK